ncbi:hypothetical protein [Embleya sp. NPDC005575]|uniref:hypothetical protein n=1 Tax=Embleya sp. NPDC005575 TaxID=3156892 RepID=UPI0033A3D2A4
MPKPHSEIVVPVDSRQLSGVTQWQLRCPSCGASSIDRAGIGPDHESIVVHPDRDDYDSPLGTRGGYVRIDLVCSTGHEFAFVIGNHKGEEYIGLVST